MDINIVAGGMATQGLGASHQGHGASLVPVSRAGDQGEGRGADGTVAGPGGSGRHGEEGRAAGGGSAAATSNQGLSPEEMAVLMELKETDAHVRRHEMAHIAAGGQYVRAGAQYRYETGPDGKRYAVAGEVSIDTSPEPDPEATIQKMEVVRRAALAPADPSPQDRRVAAKASAAIQEAMAQILMLQQGARQAEARASTFHKTL